MPVRRSNWTGKPDRPVTSFISTYENKVDKKGSRVGPCRLSSSTGKRYISGGYSLPIADRTGYRRLWRGALEELNRRRFDQSLDGGDFTQALVGRSDDGLVETIMSLASEMPFDSQGRIILPTRLAEHAGITDRATFVGRGTRFQIWSPKEHSKQQMAEITALRAKLTGGDVP